jgi:N-acetylmuramoyl-L-alanine amidase
MSRSLQGRVVVLDNARYHGKDRLRSTISLIVMHCTAGTSAHSTIAWLNRPDADAPASYHYVIDRDGTIYRHCAPETMAYHAGDSAFPADPSKSRQGSSVNPRSLGIAWANRNNGEPLTEAQIESALWLCSVFDVPPEHVVGHCEVSPGRKTDPVCMDMDEWRERLRAYLQEKAA